MRQTASAARVHSVVVGNWGMQSWWALAARPGAGHVLARQPCCQSKRPAKLGMTFKVGRRRRTARPHLLRTRPAVEPRPPTTFPPPTPVLARPIGPVCVCGDFGRPRVWHKDSCHISNLSHATQRRRQRPGHQEDAGTDSRKSSVCV